MRHLFRKTVEHGYELDRKAANSDKKDEEKSHVYQEMIKNPPRSHLGHHLDKPSHLGT